MLHVDLISTEKFEEERSLFSELLEAWSENKQLENENRELRVALNMTLPQTNLQRMDAMAGDQLIDYYLDEVCVLASLFFFVCLRVETQEVLPPTDSSPIKRARTLEEPSQRGVLRPRKLEFHSDMEEAPLALYGSRRAKKLVMESRNEK
jgi:hypothetical protein